MKKTAFFVSFILVSSILLGCTNNKDKAVSKEDIWKKIPLVYLMVNLLKKKKNRTYNFGNNDLQNKKN